MADKAELTTLEDVEDKKHAELEDGEHDQFSIDPVLNKALIRKQDLRIVPLSAGIYLLCYLDRSNIGNAKVLNEDEGNDLLSETGMTNYQYTVVRFLLGVFEAGLFPGLVYYLTFWYRTEERSLRVALVFASATLAGAFGGAIAYGVGHMNRDGGLSAWRWLFILEGIPSCLCAVLVFFLLPDYPETAKWLSDEEKELAYRRMHNEGSSGKAAAMTWEDAKATLTDWRLYAHYASTLQIYFGISAPFSSLSLFTPSLTSGLGYTGLKAQLMTVPPYAAAYVVTLLVAWSADHFNARALPTALLSLLGSLGFLLSALLPPHSFLPRYGALILAASGSFACIPPLLGWLSSNLHSTATAGLAIALNVSFGAPGQIVGVWIYQAGEREGGYTRGHAVNAGLLLGVGLGCGGLGGWYWWGNRRGGRGRGGRRFRY
ncbi:MAG: hypothetical protein Q9160_003456 [Pyrenula sp. 1 TL-2023]